MGYIKSAIGLKSYDWSSVELLKDLSPNCITGCREIIKVRQEHFWYDMGSEFDSKSFLRYFLNLKDLTLTDDFIEFVYLWHLNEQNHYRGLRKINSVLYQISESDIDKKVNTRKPMFDSISPFLSDEFTILVSIAQTRFRTI